VNGREKLRSLFRNRTIVYLCSLCLVTEEDDMELDHSDLEEEEDGDQDVFLDCEEERIKGSISPSHQDQVQRCLKI
jgi:hypothetical protein